jgi:hypothetical protein|tara:strand:+ start:232 stop:621 length:390 start_codon:yes stop_codon:yes gene_type:complete
MVGSTAIIYEEAGECHIYGLSERQKLMLDICRQRLDYYDRHEHLFHKCLEQIEKPLAKRAIHRRKVMIRSISIHINETVERARKSCREANELVEKARAEAAAAQAKVDEIKARIAELQTQVRIRGGNKN